MYLLMILAALTAVTKTAVNGECSTGDAFEVAGNWYCDSVNAIQYSPIGFPGTYSRVTDMVVDGSICTSENVSFAGPISPLDEEVSLHFRGPLALKQFAAYIAGNSPISSAAPQPTGGNSFRKERRDRGHHHKHNRQDTGAIDIFTSNITITSIITTVIEVTQTVVVCPSSTEDVNPSDPSGTSDTNNDEPLNPSTFANGTYVRTGYYNSVNGISDNLTFIGNYGGAGSGVFDYSFGPSTAYLNSDGTGAATGSEILSDTTIPSEKEFAIFSGVECTDSNSCGFVRPGSVAYHGFPGADKIFLFEFKMPFDSHAGFEGDMPAIWMLNAQIPRTLQYGQAECNCWSSGCGEFDIMEVLSPGSLYCTSTLHTNTPAGDSDYIQRPTESPIKLAVLFNAPTSGIRIQVLPDDYVFGDSLTQSDIDDILSMTSAGPMLSELKVSM